MAFGLFGSSSPSPAPTPASVNDVTPPVLPTPPSAPTAPTPPADDTAPAAPALVMPAEDSVPAEPEASFDPSSFIFSPDSLKPDTDEIQPEAPVPMPPPAVATDDAPVSFSSITDTDDATPLPPIDEEKEDEGEFSDTARHDVEEVLKHDIDSEEAEIAKMEDELSRADQAHKQAQADLDDRRKALEEYEQKIEDQQRKINDMKEEVRARRARLTKVLRDL